jgi:hypothetical protein
MTERHDQRADAHGVGVTDLGRSDAAARDTEDREVAAAIRGDDVGVDPPAIGERDASADCRDDVRVRHDEIGRPEDAGSTATGSVEFDRDLPQPLSDPGEVELGRVKRGEAAHRS